MLDTDAMEKAMEALLAAEERISALLGRPVRVRFAFSDGRPPAELALSAACRCCGLSHSELMSPSRAEPVVFARYHCFDLMHRCLRMSKVQIGACFGKNHAAVINGLRLHTLLTETSLAFRRRGRKIEREFFEQLSRNENKD